MSRICRQCKNRERLGQVGNWKNEFAFEFGSCWNQTIEYKVNDFEAEVGFFIDVLGFDCNSISEDYAMLMGPKKECFFSVRKPKENESATPADAITIEFMLADIFETAKKLSDRGIELTKEVSMDVPDYPLYDAKFQTPNGLSVRVWCFDPKSKQ